MFYYTNGVHFWRQLMNESLHKLIITFLIERRKSFKSVIILWKHFALMDSTIYFSFTYKKKPLEKWPI